MIAARSLFSAASSYRHVDVPILSAPSGHSLTIVKRIMKKQKPFIGIAGLIALIVLLPSSSQGQGHGMSPEAHDTIHSLFDSHTKFEREVQHTDNGYISKTTSNDPRAVKLIQTHVKQMEERLNKGMMVRGWDPAYVEFVKHYDDIEIKVQNIENGVEVVAVGATEDARKVARNHAMIVSKFVEHGWKEHDVSHPAVASTSKPIEEGPAGRGSCCQSSAGLESCPSGAASCSDKGCAGCSAKPSE